MSNEFVLSCFPVELVVGEHLTLSETGPVPVDWQNCDVATGFVKSLENSAMWCCELGDVRFFIVLLASCDRD